MQQRVPCEFFVVRYVPDVVKGEFVNIGVVLRELDGGAPSREVPRLRFTHDWSRVRCIDAGADIAMLEDLEQEFDRRLRESVGVPGPYTLLPLLASSLSNSIQMTEPRTALAENLTTELEQLMRMYVDPLPAARRQASTRKKTGRPAIQAAFRSAFERAGVWDAVGKRMPVERYTRRGDPLRIDWGYRRDRTGSTAEAVRMFQAVSLAGDLEMARVLAFSAPDLREGVARVEGAPLDLTAIVEPLRTIAGEDGELEERYRFGVETMERQAIRVVTVNDLPRVAETARHEMNL